MDQYSKNVISEELIFLDNDFKSQQEIISFLVEKANNAGYVSDNEELYEAVQKREKEVSTAIGYLIAIPHGKTEAVIHPFIGFIRTKDELKWSEDSEEKVRLIFLIGVPEKAEGKLHLKFISQLSKKLLDDNFREQLLTKADSQEIFNQLNDIEI